MGRISEAIISAFIYRYRAAFLASRSHKPSTHSKKEIPEKDTIIDKEPDWTSPLRGWLHQNILTGPRNRLINGKKRIRTAKKIEHARGAKLVSGGARITNIANKTEHICG